MVEDNDITLPKIPDGDGPPAFVSTPDFDKAIPDIASVLTGPAEPDLESLVFSPAIPGATVFGYLFGGEDTLGGIEDILRQRANNLNNKKISKYDMYYTPQTPLPAGLWEYKCRTCRFYNKNNGRAGQNPTCEIVGQDDDWFGGRNVHPDGWCAGWLPKEGRGIFAFLTDRLEAETRDI